MLCRPFVGLFYHGKHTSLNLEASMEKGESVLKRLLAYTRLDSSLFLFVIPISFIRQVCCDLLGLILPQVYTCLPNCGREFLTLPIYEFE